MGVAYYKNKRGISQYGSDLTRPAVGLNNYTPPSALNENYMSDMIDVEPYREEAVKFHKYTTVSKLFDTQGLNQGRPVAVIESENSDPDSGDYQFYGMSILTTGWNLFFANYLSVGVSTLTTYAMTIPSTPTYAAASVIRYSNTVFRTEADIFYVFTASNYTRLHYLKYNYAKGTNTYGYVDLPFYPASIVSHANRVFAIDIRNKLWWCRAGDLFTWYGLEYDDNMLVTSANMKNGTHILAGTVDTPRVVTATCTDTDTADTRGILTITGTNSNGDAQVAVLTLYSGRVQTPEVFATVTSVVQSGWTQGGATPDTIEVGVGPVGSGYVQDDAGYWTIESEPYLYEIFTLSNVLYISGGFSIYAFRGYSYETFALQRLVSNLGNPGAAYLGYKRVATIRNYCYFIENNEIYEFDGDNAPRIISRPVYVNNALTNGIMGGVDLAKDSTSNWVLTATADYLYVYLAKASPTVYYRFDFQTRSWWRFSGWSNTSFSSTDSVYVRLIPTFNNDDFLPFFYEHKATTEDDFWFRFGTGYDGVTQGTVYPYIITKSYNTNPSEKQTLTSVILLIKGTDGETADITLAYNNTENGTTFTTIKAYADHEFTGDMEILEIPLIGSEIANQHHYRLKLTISDMSDYPVYLYNIERRYRKQGYSR